MAYIENWAKNFHCFVPNCQPGILELCLCLYELRNTNTGFPTELDEILIKSFIAANHSRGEDSTDNDI